MSPDMYRELLLPDHQRLVDWAHGQGLKFIYHTDGDVRSLIPTFVDAGFDCIQPMEAKAGLDVRELAPQYGKDLSFFGNIDMTVASTNDREKIEHEIKTKLEAAMPYKGYLFHSDHSVPPSVSWETYQFMLELCDKYGRYD
jgi:uroporphyrinogen decarboxylase